MSLVLCGLAVYKLAQILDSLTPREAMPWVKLLVVAGLSFGAAAIAALDDLLISGFAVATIAGAVHSLLRLLTLLGDRASRNQR
jgi:hypothetical protein